jgi:hypothetical protein
MKVTLALAVALALAAGARAQNDCTTYCTTMVAANCTGNAGDPIRNQFADMTACMNACGSANWPQGGVTNASGNSLGCRIYHAGVANSTGASVHCGHAGFTGGGACGSYAENYCHYTTTCGSGAPATGCEELHADLPGTNEAFVVAAQSGNDTKTCRMYHLSVAYTLAASITDVHCAHGFLTSEGGQCGSVSDGYCDVLIGECGSANAATRQTNGLPAYVANVAECKTYGAANMNAITATNYVAGGKWNATGGDTTFCRTYHAAVAASLSDPTQKATHCRHASPSGGGQCGTYCDVYCDLFQQNCNNASSTLYSVYANRAACITACGNFPADGTPGDDSGNTVNCRIYHAAAEPLLGQVHCEHSQQNPTSQCVGGTTTTTSGSTSSGAASTTGKEDSSDAIRAGAAMGLVVLAAAATL